MRIVVLSVIVISIALPLAGQGSAPDPATLTVGERLERLEAEVGKLRAENEELRKLLADRAATAPAAAQEPPKEVPAKEQPRAAAATKAVKSVQVGGLLQGQGESGDRVDTRFPDDNARLYLRRARVNVSGTIAEKVDFRVEGDFTGSLGSTSGTRLQMTDGYVNWAPRHFAQLRVGQFKTPFGVEQLYSDARLSTPERSLSTDRLTVGRQIGLQLAGDTSSKTVSYALGLFNGNGVNTTANDDDHFMIAGRLTGKIAAGRSVIRPGVSFYSSDDENVSMSGDFRFDSTPDSPARDNIFRGTREGKGLELQAESGSFALWAERFETRFEPENAVPHDAFDASGWYAQLMWFAIPKRVQLIAKFDTFDPNDRVAGDETDEWSGGVSYPIRGDDLKLQLLYIDADGPGSNDGGRVIARVQTLF